MLKQVGGLLRARREVVMPRDVVALWLPDAGAAADPDIATSGSFAAGCDAPAMAERENRLMEALAERLKAEGAATYQFGAITAAREAALGELLPAALTRLRLRSELCVFAEKRRSFEYP